MEPVFVNPAVIISKRNDLSGGGGDAGIARRRKTLIVLSNIANGGKLGGDLSTGLTGRSIVDENHFIVGKIKAAKRFEACLERPIPIVTRHDYRNLDLARWRKVGRDLISLFNRSKSSPWAAS